MKPLLFLIVIGLYIGITVSCAEEDPEDFLLLAGNGLGKNHYGETNDSLYPSGGGIYEGEIIVKDISLFADNSKNNQSAAVFGDYLFLVTDRRSIIYTYNLKKKLLICEKRLGAVNELVGNQVLYHCNQTTFSVDFYEESDFFPLLYISQRARSDLRCFVEVYRLIPFWNGSNGDFSFINTELVQTIYFPVATMENSLSRLNCVIDSEKKLMYTYSYSYISSDPNKWKGKITCYNIPDFKEKEISLSDNDILYSFSIDCNAVNMQGGCIHNGRLYIAQGYIGAGYILLNVVNLRERKLEKQIDLMDYGVRWEPEGCFYYDDAIMLSSGSNIWRIDFEQPVDTGINNIGL